MKKIIRQPLTGKVLGVANTKKAAGYQDAWTVGNRDGCTIEEIGVVAETLKKYEQSCYPIHPEKLPQIS